MSRLERQFAQQGQGVPPAPQFARQVLERLITEKAQLQYARETGIKVDEALVDQAEQNVARQNQVERAGAAPPARCRRHRAAAVSRGTAQPDRAHAPARTRGGVAGQGQRPRGGPVPARAAAGEQRPCDPRRSTWRISWWPCPRTPTRRRSQACGPRRNGLQERARAGEDFAKLAAEALGCARAPPPTAGKSACAPPTAIRPCSCEAIQNLPEGGVSDIVRSGAGFHVIKVIEKRKGGFTGAVVQSHARHILLRPGPQLSETAAVAAAGRIQEAGAGRPGGFRAAGARVTRRTPAPRRRRPGLGQSRACSCPSSRRR